MKNWTRFYVPVLLFVGTILLGWFAIAYLSAQRVTRVDGLPGITAVALGPVGRAYVALEGERDALGDGALQAIEGGRAEPFAAGLDDPGGLALAGGVLYAADRDRIWRVDWAGAPSVWRAAGAFPRAPGRLGGLAAGPDGALYAADPEGGAVFRLPPDGPVTVHLDAGTSALSAPAGLWVDGQGALWIVDAEAGRLWRHTAEAGLAPVLDDLGGAHGVAGAPDGRRWVSHGSDPENGRVTALAPDGERTTLIRGLKAPGGLAFDPASERLFIVEREANRVTVVALEN